MPGPDPVAALPYPWAAAYNLRDFGGQQVAGGARVRTGRLFRSAQLDGGGADQSGALAALGVRRVIDLRAESEVGGARGAAFDRFAGTVHRASATDESIPHSVSQFLPNPRADEVRQHMMGVYRRLPASPRFRESAGALVRAVLAEDGAVLVHCFAGKDRTGLLVAALLLALGTHPDDVRHDYLLTNAMGPERRATTLAAFNPGKGIAVPSWIMDELLAVRPEYLEAGLETIAADHGGSAHFLCAAAGMATAVGQERLRTALLA